MYFRFEAYEKINMPETIAWGSVSADALRKSIGIISNDI
jgi:hypothetical protein